MKLTLTKHNTTKRCLLLLSSLFLILASSLAGGLTVSRAEAASNPNQAPPISDCNKAKDSNDQKKCKQEYRACNNLSGPRIGPAIIRCKKAVIDKYTNPSNPSNPGHNPGGPPSPSPASPTGCNPSGCDLIANYVNPAINLLSALFGLIAVASIIMGGIQYAASEGDPQKAANAKNRIYSTIIAIFAYLFLYAFLQFLVPGGFLH